MYQCLLVGFYFYVSYVIFSSESCIIVNFTDGLCVNVIFTGEFFFKCKLCLCYMSNENFTIEFAANAIFTGESCVIINLTGELCVKYYLYQKGMCHVIFIGESCVIVEFTSERCITKLQYINKYKDILSS